MSLRVCFSLLVYVVYVVYVVRDFEGAAGSWPGHGRGRVRHLPGEGVRGSLRVSSVSVGSFAGVGGGILVRAVVAATSSSLLSIFFCVRARKAVQAPSSRTLLLYRIQTLARIQTPSEMAGAYFSTFSCMFSVMR